MRDRGANGDVNVRRRKRVIVRPRRGAPGVSMPAPRVSHNHPDVVPPRKQRETADQRSHRQVREAQALAPPVPPPLNPKDWQGSRSPLGPLDTAAGFVLGTKPSDLPGVIKENVLSMIPGTADYQRHQNAGVTQDQLRRIQAGDPQALAEAEANNHPIYGIVPWGTFGKGIRAEMGASKAAARGARAVRRQENVAAKVDQALAESPVRQEAHAYFDRHAKSP